MMMRKFALMLALAPMLAATTLPAAPAQTTGVVIEFETKDLTSSTPPDLTTASIAGKNMRMSMAGERGQNNDVIFLGDRREMIMVEHGSKSYIVMDEATIKSLATQMSSAMAQMEEMLKGVPAEQRAMVEQMMASRGMGAPGAAPKKTPTELRRTGERATHSGYPCVKFEVLRDSRVIREFWVTEWTNIEGGADARVAFEQMAAMMQEMLNAFSQSSFGGMVSIDEPMFEYMTQINGYPVVTRELNASGAVRNETSLKSSTRKAIPASTFEPPDGYTRQNIGR
jgi:hypothetical protein